MMYINNRSRLKWKISNNRIKQFWTCSNFGDKSGDDDDDKLESPTYIRRCEILPVPRYYYHTCIDAKQQTGGVMLIC
jgi:hypothetical protein